LGAAQATLVRIGCVLADALAPLRASIALVRLGANRRLGGFASSRGITAQNTQNNLEGAAEAHGQRLAREGAALVRLHEASSRLWLKHDLREGLDEMLAGAIELLGADMGNIQIFDSARSVLEIAAHRGFGQDFLGFFREVSVADDSACGRALRSGERVVIEDIEADVPFAPFRAIARAAGFRAVQSTPIIGHEGAPLGMLSTYFRLIHRPAEESLRLLDLYVAAGFIERCRADEALREMRRACDWPSRRRKSARLSGTSRPASIHGRQSWRRCVAWRPAHLARRSLLGSNWFTLKTALPPSAGSSGPLRQASRSSENGGSSGPTAACIGSQAVSSSSGTLPASHCA
jgi:hypothetical protein